MESNIFVRCKVARELAASSYNWTVLFIAKEWMIKSWGRQANNSEVLLWLTLIILVSFVWFLPRCRSMLIVWQQHSAVCVLQEKTSPEAGRVLHHQLSRQRPGPDAVSLPSGHNIQLLPQVLWPILQFFFLAQLIFKVWATPHVTKKKITMWICIRSALWSVRCLCYILLQHVTLDSGQGALHGHVIGYR